MPFIVTFTCYIWNQEAAKGERDYFTDDPARDYDSYYAQVADDAMMGDESAMEEMRGEFWEGDWWYESIYFAMESGNFIF